MLAVKGYFDGETIKPLEKIVAKPYQQVIITVIDEFVEPEKINNNKNIRGIISEFANPNLIEEEKNAWERATIRKYGNI